MNSENEIHNIIDQFLEKHGLTFVSLLQNSFAVSELLGEILLQIEQPTETTEELERKTSLLLNLNKFCSSNEMKAHNSNNKFKKIKQWEALFANLTAMNKQQLCYLPINNLNDIIASFGFSKKTTLLATLEFLSNEYAKGTQTGSKDTIHNSCALFSDTSNKTRIIAEQILAFLQPMVSVQQKDNNNQSALYGTIYAKLQDLLKNFLNVTKCKILFLGETSSGKSTLMNAVLHPYGYLSTGGGIVTKVSWEMSYSQSPKLYGVDKAGKKHQLLIDGNLKDTIAHYKSDKESNFERFLLNVPADILCSECLSFVDCPGLNAKQVFEQKVKEEASSISAIFVLCELDKGLTSAIKSFLRQLLIDKMQYFQGNVLVESDYLSSFVTFVITKLDRVENEEREKLTANLKEQIANFFTDTSWLTTYEATAMMESDHLSRTKMLSTLRKLREILPTLQCSVITMNPLFLFNSITKQFPIAPVNQYELMLEKCAQAVNGQAKMLHTCVETLLLMLLNDIKSDIDTTSKDIPVVQTQISTVQLALDRIQKKKGTLIAMLKEEGKKQIQNNQEQFKVLCKEATTISRDKINSVALQLKDEYLSIQDHDVDWYVKFVIGEYAKITEQKLLIEMKNQATILSTHLESKFKNEFNDIAQILDYTLQQENTMEQTKIKAIKGNMVDFTEWADYGIMAGALSAAGGGLLLGAKIGASAGAVAGPFSGATIPLFTIFGGIVGAISGLIAGGDTTDYVLSSKGLKWTKPLIQQMPFEFCDAIANQFESKYSSNWTTSLEQKMKSSLQQQIVDNLEENVWNKLNSRYDFLTYRNNRDQYLALKKHAKAIAQQNLQQLLQIKGKCDLILLHRLFNINQSELTQNAEHSTGYFKNGTYLGQNVWVCNLEKDANDTALIISEYRELAMLDHPNMITCFGTAKSEKCITLLYEKLGSPLLPSEEFASNKEKLLTTLISMAECLLALHQQRKCHKHLSLASFYWNKDGSILKLADLGLVEAAKYMMLNHKNEVENWLAPPELVKNACNWSTCSDVFSFGIIAFQLITNGESQPTNLREVLFPNKFGEPLCNLLYKCIAITPEQRISMSDIVSALHYLLVGNEQSLTRRTSKAAILSLDGGGSRGVVSSTILNALNLKLHEQIKLSNADDSPNFTEFFDLIGGTSTGGIIALGSVLQEKNANELTQQYKLHASKIFSSKKWLISNSCFYNHITLNEELKRAFGSTTMTSKAKPHVFVVCKENNEPGPLLVCNYANEIDNGATHRVSSGWSAAEAATATASAPLLFSPFSKNGNYYTDGGTGFNNPTLIALQEAAILQKTTKIVVSIGTGTKKMNPSDGFINSWSKLPIVGGAMKLLAAKEYFVNQLTQTNGTHVLVKDWCNNFNIKYYRFNFSLPSHIPANLDIADADKLQQLIEHTEKYIAQSSTQLQLTQLAADLVQLKYETSSKKRKLYNSSSSSSLHNESQSKRNKPNSPFTKNHKVIIQL